MMSADARILTIRLRVMMLSLTLRGGFLITSRSTGSTPKLTAERTKHTHTLAEAAAAAAKGHVTPLYL